MSQESSRYELALQVGVEAVRQGKWRQAGAALRLALEGLPEDARVHAALGDVHLGRGDAQSALAAFALAVRYAPDEPLYLEKVSAAQEQLGRPKVAAEALLAAGDIYWRQNAPDQARLEWERAAALSHFPPAHDRLAMFYRHRGDQTAVQGQYVALIEALQAHGRYLSALHVARTALALTPEDTALQHVTDLAWRKAAARTRAALDDPYSVRPADLLAAASELAQWELTAEVRQGSLAPPDSARARRNKLLSQAILHEGRGRAGAAIGSYERAVVEGLRLPAVFFVLGLLYRLVGRRVDSEAALILAAGDPFYGRARQYLPS